MSGAHVEQIEAVYRSRVAEFCRVAAAIVGDRDAAADVVQDAFASAVRARARFRGDGPLEAWLWRLVVNEARDVARAARRGEVIEFAPPAARPEHDRVGAAVAALPERQRLTLFLRYDADLEYAEIADGLGISVGTVGATLTAARDAVRRALEEVA